MRGVALLLMLGVQVLLAPASRAQATPAGIAAPAPAEMLAVSAAVTPMAGGTADADPPSAPDVADTIVVNGDAAAQFIRAKALFKGRHVARDRVRGYAQMRLVAMAGYAPAERALRRMRHHISIADRVRAVDMLAEVLLPPLPEAPPVARLAAAWTPDDEPQTGDPVAASAASPVAAAPARAGRRHSSMVRVTSLRHAARRTAAPLVRLATASRPANAPWTLQLGAFRKAGGAERQWASLRRHAIQLAAFRPRFQLAGGLTRLRLTGLDKPAALRLCARIVAQGGSCLAIAPRAPPLLFAAVTGTRFGTAKQI